jgi:hypothetical protein
MVLAGARQEVGSRLAAPRRIVGRAEACERFDQDGHRSKQNATHAGPPVAGLFGDVARL